MSNEIIQVPERIKKDFNIDYSGISIRAINLKQFETINEEQTIAQFMK